MCSLHSAAPEAAVFKRPWDVWTWDRPVGRALSAALGAGALAAVGVLGGFGLWSFWVAFFAPDVALFYDARNAGPDKGQLSPRAARLYNVLHNPPLSLIPLAAGAVTGNTPALVAGLAWFTHIALDRALRFGPRRPDGRFH